nr:hypothetical protein [Tanacetum cinerariifolium]
MHVVDVAVKGAVRKAGEAQGSWRCNHTRDVVAATMQTIQFGRTYLGGETTHVMSLLPWRVFGCLPLSLLKTSQGHPMVVYPSNNGLSQMPTMHKQTVCEITSLTGVAAVVHLYAFPAVPYKYGERCGGQQSLTHEDLTNLEIIEDFAMNDIGSFGCCKAPQKNLISVCKLY